MEIVIGQEEHISIIRDIANKTWAETYKQILSKEQSEYMINLMYNPLALKEQMYQLNHHFLLIKNNDSTNLQGFVSYELNYKGTPKTKIHKLYILPECHGLGMGRILINRVSDEALKNDNIAILLNMNRFNKALNFYEHIGFKIIGEEDIDIGNGYLMEDYIFEKTI